MHKLIVSTLLTLGAYSVPLPCNAQLPPLKRAAQADPAFSRLGNVLTQYGFILKSGQPPRRGVYGFLHVPSKVIWINPAVFELGIAQPTLVHEAVHAAQSCASGKTLMPLGLEITPPKRARPYFLRYHGHRQQVEAEAYAVQTQPNGIQIAIDLLNQHCQ